MDALHFDRLTRSFAATFSRRLLLRGVAALGPATAAVPGAASARKRRKKPRRNAFGCVDVGRFCKHAGQCCSGICQGKKGGKTCKSHDTGGCQSGQDTCLEFVACTTTAGVAGECFTTTGNAGFCGGLGAGTCMDCTRDADCRALKGPRAACGLCASCSDEVTACVGPEPEL